MLNGVPAFFLPIFSCAKFTYPFMKREENKARKSNMGFLFWDLEIFFGSEGI